MQDVAKREAVSSVDLLPSGPRIVPTAMAPDAPKSASRGLRRSHVQKVWDTITFPARAFTLFDHNRWTMTSLRSERFDYAARHVQGWCLDVGCGPHDTFIQKYCAGQGKGIDVFAYPGLTDEHLVDCMPTFPFEDNSFQTVTFIASLNHVPAPLRAKELAEAYRCLTPGGNIVVTMGLPLVEVAVHHVIYWHDKLFGTNYDLDSQRGMEEEEDYYLTGPEIRSLLSTAGFRDISVQAFGTQWRLNRLFVGWKR